MSAKLRIGTAQDRKDAEVLVSLNRFDTVVVYNGVDRSGHVSLVFSCPAVMARITRVYQPKRRVSDKDGISVLEFHGRPFDLLDLFGRNITMPPFIPALDEILETPELFRAYAAIC